MLRVASSFPEFLAALGRVAVLERSQDLRETQCRALEGTQQKIHDNQLKSALFFQKSHAKMLYWYDSINELPDDKPIIAIGQEFLDAFPVHQLVRSSSDAEWREKLISTASSEEDDNTPYHFTTVLSPSATPIVKVCTYYICKYIN